MMNKNELTSILPCPNTLKKSPLSVRDLRYHENKYSTFTYSVNPNTTNTPTDLPQTNQVQDTNLHEVSHQAPGPNHLESNNNAATMPINSLIQEESASFCGGSFESCFCPPNQTLRQMKRHLITLALPITIITVACSMALWLLLFYGQESPDFLMVLIVVSLIGAVSVIIFSLYFIHYQWRRYRMLQQRMEMANAMNLSGYDGNTSTLAGFSSAVYPSGFAFTENMTTYLVQEGYLPIPGLNTNESETLSQASTEVTANAATNVTQLPPDVNII